MAVCHPLSQSAIRMASAVCANVGIYEKFHMLIEEQCSYTRCECRARMEAVSAFGHEKTFTVQAVLK